MTIFIADISHYQAGLSMQTLHRSGFAAVILKACEGVTYVDPSFAGWLAQARSLGLPVAAYHFVHPGGWSGQAALIRRVVPADVPVWLDVEGGSTRDDAYAIADLVRAAGGTLGGIYHGAQPKPGYGGWWRAAYFSDPSGSAVQTYAALGGDRGAGWAPGPDLWQFCQHGRIPGYAGGDVDFSAFRGTRDQLLGSGWFWTPPAKPLGGPSMFVIKTPANGSFAVWPDGDHMAYVRVDDATAARWVSGGMQQLTLGAADATTLMHLQASVQDVITVPPATVDVQTLAAELMLLLPQAGLTAEHVADVLATRLAQ